MADVDLNHLEGLRQEAERGYKVVRYQRAVRNAAPALLAEVRQLRQRNVVVTELLSYLVHNFINLDSIPEDMGDQIRACIQEIESLNKALQVYRRNGITLAILDE